MLSFIRKRLPSKDRSHEHHLSKDDEHMKNFKSEEKKKKKKEKSSSTIDVLVVGSNTSPTINQSFSNVDYFTMMPAGSIEPLNNDSYLNSPENIRGKKPGIIEIPITFTSKDPGKTNQPRS